MMRLQNADRLNRLERWTEWPLTILALALIPLLLAPYLFSLSSRTKSILVDIDYLIWGLFAVDLVTKVTIAPRRLSYLRRHWIDVLLVAVPLLRPLRVARSVRAARAIGALRVSSSIGRAVVGGRRILTRHGLQYILAVATGVIVLASALIPLAERDEADATITSFSDGLWWAITTVTTVGYGDTYPKSSLGRGVGVLLMVLGISLFSAVTANVAAFFVEEREDLVAVELRELRDELRMLREIRSVRADQSSRVQAEDPEVQLGQNGDGASTGAN